MRRSVRTAFGLTNVGVPPRAKIMIPYQMMSAKQKPSKSMSKTYGIDTSSIQSK